MRLTLVTSLLTVVSVHAGVPFVFQAKSPAVASEINANFAYLDAIAKKIDTSKIVTKDTAARAVLSGSDAKLSITDNESSTDISVSKTSYVYPGGRFDWYIKDDKLNLQQLAFDGTAFLMPLLSVSWYNIKLDRSIIVNGDEILNGGLTASGPSVFSSDVTVQGTLYAKTQSTQVPDYVFGDSYKLMPLAKVEEFVKSNRHLPGIPSASEMETKNVNLVEMNMLLLQKIEELTLHVIEQQKQIEEIKRK